MMRRRDFLETGIVITLMTIVVISIFFMLWFPKIAMIQAFLTFIATILFFWIAFSWFFRQGQTKPIRILNDFAGWLFIGFGLVALWATMKIGGILWP
jgi:amino acid permease